MRAERERLAHFWERARNEVYRSPEELKAQHEREIRKGIFYRKLIRGNSRIKAVALTFDDGPRPGFTPRLLAVLQKHDVRATFFVVGKLAEKHPDLIKAQHDAGHVIANHTYHHVNLTHIPVDDVRAEWQRCNDVVQSILGVQMTFCRPPGGDYDAVVIDTAMDLGLTTVLWTDDPADYASPGDTAIERGVLDHIINGAIILLHSGVQQTIDVLPQIIESLKERGYRLQTVEELARDAATD